MAEAYICDACGITITDPHKVKMKEFYIGCSFDMGGGVFPSFDTRRVKVHLCDDCYHALCEIAEKKNDGGRNGKEKRAR